MTYATGMLTGKGHVALARFSTIYRPEQFGAVGDGIADDWPAFEGMRAAIAANPSRPARIVVTQTHYLSDSVSFDAENIECHLAAGSHIFTTDASTHGHCLGFIGYLGSGTATSPRRASLTITGTGKVTGWMGGTNENGIGIVRYDRVYVGPVEASGGNKGVTAQYGCRHVSLDGTTVPQAGIRGVSMEDQGGVPLVVRLRNVRVGTAGHEGVLLAASSVDIDGLEVDEAFTSGGTPTNGAVHLNSNGILRQASLANVHLADANVGKGIVITGATAASASNVRVDAATGNAVEFYNCGSAYARQAPGAVATGTTPTLSVPDGPWTATGADVDNAQLGVFTAGATELGRFRRLAGSTNLGLLVALGRIFRIDGAASTTTPLVVRSGANIIAALNQAVDVFRVEDLSGSVLIRVLKGGQFAIRRNAAPADADIAVGEVAFWFDSTSGAAKVMFKGKDAGGAVRTGSVLLS